MNLKLEELKSISVDETYYIVGGFVNPEKKALRKKRREERKRTREARRAERRVCNSDATDTVKNDIF